MQLAKMAESGTQRNQPIHEAAKRGDLATLKKLLKRGLFAKAVDIDEPGDDLRTPLHFAAAGSNVEAVKLILEQKATLDKLDRREETALHLAAATGTLATVKLLVEHKAALEKVGAEQNTALLYALQRSELDIAKFLIDSKAAVENAPDTEPTYLHACVGMGSIEAAKLLIERKASLVTPVTVFLGYRLTPLHTACTLETPGMAAFLLDCGADVNAQVDGSVTPLMVAAFYGRDAVVTLLLERGADPAIKARAEAPISGVLTALEVANIDAPQVIAVLKGWPNSIGFLLNSLGLHEYIVRFKAEAVTSPDLLLKLPEASLHDLIPKVSAERK